MLGNCEVDRETCGLRALAEESSDGGEGETPRGAVGVDEPDPTLEDRPLVLVSDTSSLAPSKALNADRVNGGVSFGVPNCSKS